MSLPKLSRNQGLRAGYLAQELCLVPPETQPWCPQALRTAGSLASPVEPSHETGACVGSNFLVVRFAFKVGQDPKAENFLGVSWE